ncbi:hypothetical protein [Salinarimonas soli]|uniref:Uncharacterized protein n=1 Tax=Salinarimonas soli TaxID=1638099 RepID=A0A5B2VSI0_9HYPH|nr:hypothetical protein [Salinarimonas soli]KAA2242181.1 hypothetical protein F0L46_02510 [Salinarimonas soli]
MPLRLAALALIASTALAAAQGTVPPQTPLPGVAPGATPNATLPAAPGSPPASTAVDISASRPENLPLMEGRPAATQAVPGPNDPGAIPPSPAPRP